MPKLDIDNNRKKAKNSRNRKQKSGESHAVYQDNVRDPGKRKFLIGAGALAAAALGGFYLFRPQDGFIKQQEEQPAVKQEDIWDFLEELRQKPSTDEATVRRIAVPFSPEMPVYKDTRIFHEMQAQLDYVVQALPGYIIEKGFNPKGKYKVSLTMQLFGIPETHGKLEHMLSYCREAVEFMHHALPQLDRHPINWQPLVRGKPVKTDASGTVFMGEGYYEARVVKAVNALNPAQGLRFPFIAFNYGSFMYNLFDEKTRDLESWYSFFTSGPLAIVSPFSELIPLTTGKKGTTEFVEEVGQKFHSQLGETISESLSLTLAKEMVRRKNIPYGTEILEETLRLYGANEKYMYVGKAIRWIERNSPQAALDLYMDSPKKFFKAIQSG